MSRGAIFGPGTKAGLVRKLSIAELEDLGEALLDFTEMANLEVYLEKLG